MLIQTMPTDQEVQLSKETIWLDMETGTLSSWIAGKEVLAIIRTTASGVAVRIVWAKHPLWAVDSTLWRKTNQPLFQKLMAEDWTTMKADKVVMTDHYHLITEDTYRASRRPSFEQDWARLELCLANTTTQSVLVNLPTCKGMETHQSEITRAITRISKLEAVLVWCKLLWSTLTAGTARQSSQQIGGERAPSPRS